MVTEPFAAERFLELFAAVGFWSATASLMSRVWDLTVPLFFLATSSPFAYFVRRTVFRLPRWSSASNLGKLGGSWKI
jgi:hypothetical protein